MEIQSIGSREFIQRSLYYWSKLYASQLKEGHEYKKLNPVICINLLDFILFPDMVDSIKVASDIAVHVLFGQEQNILSVDKTGN